MLVVVICGDGAVLDGAALRDVTVIRWGKDHGRLVCLRVLMVQIDHAPTSVWGSRHTVEEEQE